MRYGVCAGVFASVLIAAGAAQAAPLTCEMFKERLHNVVDREGNKIAQINHYRLVYDGGDAGRRYEWDDIVNLSGNLNCGKNDEFVDFSVELDPGNGLKAVDHARMAVLASTSVCALTSSDHDACFAFVQKMLTVSTKQFKTEVDRGEKYPSGSCDFFLFDKVDAEYDVSAASFMWTVGPGTFGPMSSDQVPLNPSRRDAD